MPNSLLASVKSIDSIVKFNLTFVKFNLQETVIKGDCKGQKILHLKLQYNNMLQRE